MTNLMSERARRLRKEKTPAERRLWRKLRELNAEGFHFRQQAPIGAFIADFADLSLKLVVEVDGSQHGSHDGQLRDAERTRWLQGCGFKVLRFWNADVMANLEGVMTSILVAAGVLQPGHEGISTNNAPGLVGRGRDE